MIVVGAGMAGLAAAYYLEKARQADPYCGLSSPGTGPSAPGGRS
ncbi:MAG: NAD(P)-binding protein [Bacillota bacterium]